MPRAPDDPISSFYLAHLADARLEGHQLSAPCPFCAGRSSRVEQSRLIVTLQPGNPLHGYFRCMARCVPGGFPLHFARLAGLDPAQAPGYDPDREPLAEAVDYPAHNLNQEIDQYALRLADDPLPLFRDAGIAPAVLAELRVGFNGRYVVYPYFQPDGNCHAARCVCPDQPEDQFWHGNQDFAGPAFHLFNGADIDRCENGALCIVEGENNLVALKQLGLPGIAVPSAADLALLPIERLAWLHTIYLIPTHHQSAEAAARLLATRLGHRTRVLRWPREAPRHQSLFRLATEQREAFPRETMALLRRAKPFSPFPSPEKERLGFLDRLRQESGSGHQGLHATLPLFDQALGGLHGLNILGGAPKTGKSCLSIQIATDMARHQVPVLYYDFENGRQKIYQRTCCRLGRLSLEELRAMQGEQPTPARLQTAMAELEALLPWFRLVNDRGLTAELLRRHVDFLRHETGSDSCLVVIDSLHKLPFKDMGERRSGIDAWLRQFEAIRDELGVGFLVISELSRDKDEGYGSRPHLGSFKESGDIEYTADNALALVPEWDPFQTSDPSQRSNSLWLVASREQTPGLVARYRLDYPYWGFREEEADERSFSAS